MKESVINIMKKKLEMLPKLTWSRKEVTEFYEGGKNVIREAIEAATEVDDTPEDIESWLTSIAEILAENDYKMDTGLPEIELEFVNGISAQIDDTGRTGYVNARQYLKGVIVTGFEALEKAKAVDLWSRIMENYLID